MLPATHRNTQVVVDLNIIKNNIQQIQQRYPEQPIFTVVKANAYGHGMIEVAQAASEVGVAGFCVALLDEAIALRKAGFQQTILVLGISRVEDVSLLAEYQISATVSSLEWLEQALPLLENQAQPLRVHLAFDTGMGRIGFCSKDSVLQVVSYLKKYSERFIFEGVFTHFAKADDADEEHLREQLQRFDVLVNEALVERPQYVHCSNSAYALWHHAAESEVIRLGIGMYGVNPSNEALSLPQVFDLQPALRWETELVHVKKVPQGTTISYGATYVTAEEEWIGTLPIGYADGYIRAYHTGEVIVNGVRCPIVGRICMDQCMVRLPHEMPIGTKVTLLGRDGDEEITAEELSHRSDTIGYEVLCIISDRVPRVYQK